MSCPCKLVLHCTIVFIFIVHIESSGKVYAVEHSQAQSRVLTSTLKIVNDTFKKEQPRCLRTAIAGEPRMKNGEKLELEILEKQMELSTSGIHPIIHLDHLTKSPRVNIVKKALRHQDCTDRARFRDAWRKYRTLTLLSRSHWTRRHKLENHFNVLQNVLNWQVCVIS